MTRLLPKAIALAAEIHEDQVDKGGQAYILHPLRVMETAMKIAPPEIDREFVGILGVLHDVLEDNSKYTDSYIVQILEERGFGPHHILALRVLTKQKGEPYQDYIDRIDHGTDFAYICRWVKLADLQDNLRIDRQPSMEERDMKRIQKYHHAYRQLHPDFPDF